MLGNDLRTGVGAQWPFLSDAGQQARWDLDLAEYTDPERDPMVLHTLVLEPGLVVHSPARLRAARARGEKERFLPYGRSLAKVLFDEQ